MQRLILVVGAFVLVAGVAVLSVTRAPSIADEDSKASNPGRRFRVVATTGMVADAVRAVGGEAVEVSALMGPGVDPHLFKASEGDVARMAGADAVFFNGLHLEGKLAEVLAQMRRRGVPAIAVAEQIEPSQLQRTAAFDGNYDPHIWFDVRLWMRAVQAIGDQLAQLVPDEAAMFRANAVAYMARLQQLDDQVRAAVNVLPSSQRVLVTAHDAFGYFARAYGFEVHGIQGVSTATEAGTADIQRLAELIAQRRVPAVFIETSVPPRIVEALQAAVRARGFEVQIGGELYSDALGDTGSGAETYDGMVRHNVKTIVEALRRPAADG